MKNATPKLRIKSFTIVEQACHEILGFSKLYQELRDKVTLSGHTVSTLSNYARMLAQLSLHFGKLPQHISEGEKKLQVVLNRSECRALFKGMIGVLYTWGQNLSLHPHVHCIVPGGGIDYRGRWKRVQFSYTDYRDNRSKAMKLTGMEFLRRFCQHILPKGFVRIRHYGLLSAGKKAQLRQLQQALGVSNVEKRIKKDWKQLCREHLGFDPDLCPECRQGRMVIIQRLNAVRGPPERLWNRQVANGK